MSKQARTYHYFHTADPEKQISRKQDDLDRLIEKFAHVYGTSTDNIKASLNDITSKYSGNDITELRDLISDSLDKQYKKIGSTYSGFKNDYGDYARNWLKVRNIGKLSSSSTPNSPTPPTGTPINPVLPTLPVISNDLNDDYFTEQNDAFINGLIQEDSNNPVRLNLSEAPLKLGIYQKIYNQGHDLSRRQARRVDNGRKIRLQGQGRQNLDQWEGAGWQNAGRKDRIQNIVDTGKYEYVPLTTETNNHSSFGAHIPRTSNLQGQAGATNFTNWLNNFRSSLKNGGKFINWVTVNKRVTSARRGARLMPIAQAGGKPWRGAPQDGSVWGGAGQTIPDWYDPNAYMYPGYRDPNMPAYDSPGIHQIIGPDYEWDPEAQTRERIDMAMRNDVINAQLVEDAAYRDMMYQAGRLPKGQLETSVPQGGLAYPDNYGAMNLTKRQARRTYNGKKVKYNGNQVQLNKGRGYGYWNVPRGGMVSNTPEQMRAAGFSF